MAHYLVYARLYEEQREELEEKVHRREFSGLRPFGEALHYSLEHARIDPQGMWVWEELDFCTPPLKQEKAAVLDRYFDITEIIPVEEGEGWQKIGEYPRAIEPPPD